MPKAATGVTKTVLKSRSTITAQNAKSNNITTALTTTPSRKSSKSSLLKASPIGKKSTKSSRSTLAKESPKKEKKEHIIPENTLLSDFVQSLIDKEWKGSDWTPSKGYSMRIKCQELLLNAFLSGMNRCDLAASKEGEKDNEEEEYKKRSQILSTAIEQAVYDNLFIRNPTKYSQKIRDLCRHLPKNAQRFMSIDPTFTASMSHREMVDYHTEKEKDIVDYRKENIYGTKTSDIRCKNYKCRGINIGTYDLTTRSVDEGATAKYECYDCGWKWKETA